MYVDGNKRPYTQASSTVLDGHADRGVVDNVVVAIQPVANENFRTMPRSSNGPHAYVYRSPHSRGEHACMRAPLTLSRKGNNKGGLVK